MVIPWRITLGRRCVFLYAFIMYRSNYNQARSSSAYPIPGHFSPPHYANINNNSVPIPTRCITGKSKSASSRTDVWGRFALGIAISESTTVNQSVRMVSGYRIVKRGRVIIEVMSLTIYCHCVNNVLKSPWRCNNILNQE